MRIALLVCLVTVPIFASDLSGYLVDSKCYAAEERNVNPGDGNPHADSDMDYEIRYCAPTAKTKEFAVVPADWNAVNLDAAGNVRAAELVRSLTKTHFLRVEVTGEQEKHTIQVTTLVQVSRPVRVHTRIAHE